MFKRLFFFIVGVLLILLTASSLMVNTKKDEKIIEKFAKAGVAVSIEYLKTENRSIRVVATEPKESDSTLIVFIHGAPGSWDAFEKYMMDSSFLARGRLVSYDRPGYGESGKESMKSISDQADILKQIIETYKMQDVVVIGHSYGGPIAGNISGRYPEIIDKAVMIAPLNDPDNEPIFWVSHFAKWKATKWILPNGMKTAGDEKFSHAEHLDKMRDLWPDLKIPILHIHGDSDMLAPSEPNISWSENHIPEHILQLEILEDEGHLVLWQAYPKVKSLILDFIK